MDEITKIIKGLIDLQKAQTEALIRAQSEAKNKILISISQTLSRVSLVPSFEIFNKEKEAFVTYQARL